MVAGLAVVIVLTALRARWVWSPLHPIGYAAANTDIMAWIWLPVLIGWLCKSVILKYGGIGLYRQALPFFIGLVLGDYAISGLWSLVFMLLATQGTGPSRPSRPPVASRQRPRMSCRFRC